MNKVCYLYIKELPTRLKYLGVTTRDPYKYLGSGKYWRRHIKFYNYGYKDIKTTILLETEDLDIIRFFGLYYSKLYNIVESNEWANLMPESGELSVLGMKHSDESKLKMSNSLKGRKLSTECKNKMSISMKGNKYNLGKKQSKEHIKTRIDALIGHKFNVGRKHSEEWINKQAKKLYKKIFCIDKDGNRLDFESILDAYKFLNRKRSGSISACLTGVRPTMYGYKWYYNKEMVENKLNEIR